MRMPITLCLAVMPVLVLAASPQTHIQPEIVINPPISIPEPAPAPTPPVQTRALKINDMLKDVPVTFPGGLNETLRQSTLAYFSCNKSVASAAHAGFNGIAMMGGSKIRFNRDLDYKPETNQPAAFEGNSPAAQIECTGTREREYAFLADFDTINMSAGQNRWEPVKPLPGSGKPSVAVFFYCRENAADRPTLDEGIVLAKGTRIVIARDVNFAFANGHKPFASDSWKPNVVISCD